MAETRPNLRSCPFCHADGEEKIYFIKEVAVFSDCEYEAGYTVRCIECGASVSDEYSDEAVRLWNGAQKPSDEEEDGEMKNPNPVNLQTSEEVRKAGWQAECRDAEGHLMRVHAPFETDDDIIWLVRDALEFGETVTIWPTARQSATTVPQGGKSE